jgi:hypothetical protein
MQFQVRGRVGDSLLRVAPKSLWVSDLMLDEDEHVAPPGARQILRPQPDRVKQGLDVWGWPSRGAGSADCITVMGVLCLPSTRAMTPKCSQTARSTRV